MKKILPSIGDPGFCLAGGSGLALQIGHRVSEDLDFFTSQPFASSSLATSLAAKADKLEEILTEAQTFIADLEGVKCSFFYHEIPLTFKMVFYEGLKIAHWRDILAEKFKTLAQRGSKKDFYDIFCVLQAKKISLEEAVSIFRKRFQSSGVNYYHVLRSLAYFEDADLDPDPKTLKGFDVSWQEVKSFFVNRQPEFERWFLSSPG